MERIEPRSRRNWHRVLVLGILVGALGLAAAFPPRPLLVWNVSASAPVGVYAVGGVGTIAAGDMVLARAPERWRKLAAARHYLPANVPLVKRAAALSGDTVCAVGETIFVNGRQMARRRAADGRGRAMPWWTGCETLSGDTLFLLMDAPDSFDGRYFGPTRRGDVIGEARLLWGR